MRVREREGERDRHRQTSRGGEWWRYLLSPRGSSVLRSSPRSAARTLVGVGQASKNALTASFTVSPPLVREHRMQHDKSR